jgi:uncharacterized protein YdaU (DUF1376 family)
MHYYQFHIGDYKSHTHHLSLIEDLAFRRLLDHYYLHQQPIKQRDIARQIGMREHEQEVLTVLDEFFVSTESGYINPRADKEIKAFVEHQATSAYGAFVRDNPTLKPITDKQLFIEHHMAGSIADYVNLLKSSCVVDVPIASTSRGDDATNNQEPITINHKPNKQKATVVATPVGVSQSVWDEFIAHRKAKKAKVTELVVEGIAKEANKAGWSLEDALKETIVRNWQSFKADWVASKQPQSISFAQQDEMAKRRKWEEMTGRQWPSDDRLTIDVTPTFLEIEK